MPPSLPLLLIAAIGVLATAPVVVALLGRLRQRVPSLRGLVDLAAVVLLWLALDASLLGIWGATVARRSEAVTALLLGALVVAQPFVPFACWVLVVRRRPPSS